MKNDFNIKVAGEAGAGVKITGLTLARSLNRMGFSTFSYTEYPSLIRGGHNIYQIHAGADEVYSQIKPVDLLLAFNKQAIIDHQKELNNKSLIFYDPDKINLDDLKNLTGHYLPILMKETAQKVGGNPLMANTVALGACLAIFGLELDQLKKIVTESFAHKGEAVIKSNQDCVQAGYDLINDKFADQKIDIKNPEKIVKRMVITGNEATALGAISGGLKFYCAYPMTPATSILHFLAAQAEKQQIVVKQPEDEIAAVNQTIGASFAGVRAMTATSGGGFCLMTEGLGFAGISETPIVIVNSQRPGPASGLPTWSGQGDLQFMIHASQDEFPRIVLAPGDAQECFDLTKLALDLAEMYQLPAIILLDKNISESLYSNSIFPTKRENQRYSMTDNCDNFLRYKITKNGISPRPILGQKDCHHLCNSYEHDEYGLTTEDGQQRIDMVDKRNRKLATLKKVIPQPKIYGPKKADISIISWGSNKGMIREALKSLPGVNFIHLSWLWPFPVEQVKEFLTTAKRTICLECNSEGQLANLIFSQTGQKVNHKFLKYDSRPFYPKEIRDYVEKLND